MVAVPSVNDPPVTAPEAVTVVNPLAAPLVMVAVPSVNDPPVTAPEAVRAPLVVVVVAVMATIPSVLLDILSPLPKVTSLPVTVTSPVNAAFPVFSMAMRVDQDPDCLLSMVILPPSAVSSRHLSLSLSPSSA